MKNICFRFIWYINTVKKYHFLNEVTYDSVFWIFLIGVYVCYIQFSNQSLYIKQLQLKENTGNNYSFYFTFFIETDNWITPVNDISIEKIEYISLFKYQPNSKITKKQIF